jgi:hypothetical protein
MRYDGYLPLASSKKKTTAGNNIKAKLAALLRPTTKQSKQDEHQNLYYDRQG